MVRDTKDNALNAFIWRILRSEVTPRHFLIFPFWHGGSRSRMEAMSGEILQAGVNPVHWRIAGPVIQSSHHGKHVIRAVHAPHSYVPQPTRSVATPRPSAVKGVVRAMLACGCAWLRSRCAPLTAVAASLPGRCRLRRNAGLCLTRGMRGVRREGTPALLAIP